MIWVPAAAPEISKHPAGSRPIISQASDRVSLLRPATQFVPNRDVAPGIIVRLHRR